MQRTSWLSGVKVNTGENGSAIWLVEEYFHRSMKLFVCMLHANELPLRYLFEQLDGLTTGPKSYSGPVANLCKDADCTIFKRYNVIYVRLASTS